MVSERILLATDFDGTLAPIRKNPAAVLPDPELSSFLCDAAELEGVAVAIISGRDIDDLAHRVGAIPAYLAGSHGLEIRGPGGRMLRQTPPLNELIDRELERAIVDAGARLERKKHGVVLHWRGVPDFDEHHPLAAEFRSWATARGLDLIAGRMVIEAIVDGGGKERALTFIAKNSTAGRIVYAGDDLTDFPALAFAAERGRAIFMRSEEREAPPGALVVGSHGELLRALQTELREHLQRFDDVNMLTT